jgi:hypothetical protein
LSQDKRWHEVFKRLVLEFLDDLVILCSHIDYAILSFLSRRLRLFGLILRINYEAFNFFHALHILYKHL